jgi:hypothetical protein
LLGYTEQFVITEACLLSMDRDSKTSTELFTTEGYLPSSHGYCAVFDRVLGSMFSCVKQICVSQGNS